MNIELVTQILNIVKYCSLIKRSIDLFDLTEELDKKGFTIEEEQLVEILNSLDNKQLIFKTETFKLTDMGHLSLDSDLPVFLSDKPEDVIQALKYYKKYINELEHTMDNIEYQQYLQEIRNLGFAISEDNSDSN